MTSKRFRVSNRKEQIQLPNCIDEQEQEMLETGRIPASLAKFVKAVGVFAIFEHFGLPVPDAYLESDRSSGKKRK